MTFKQLKQDILGLLEEYISEAENFERKKSENQFCRLFRYFKQPYRHLEQARDLKSKCEDTTNPFDLIKAIHTMCENIRHSRTLLPKITQKIAQSQLFPDATRLYCYIIDEDLPKSEHYILVIKKAARIKSIQMEKLPPTNARASL